MASLNNVDPDDIGDLNDSTLFTEGAIKNKYDQYMDALDKVNGYAGDFSVNPGEIAIIYNQDQMVTINSLGN